MLVACNTYCTGILLFLPPKEDCCWTNALAFVLLLIAFDIFYTSLDLVKNKLPNEEKTPLEIWKKSLENITPLVEVKSRRIGGATFQVPTEIRPDRKESISMKNLITYARKRGGRSMAEKLAAEIVDAYNNQGGAFKRKEDMHRMAEANRAFAFFKF